MWGEGGGVRIHGAWRAAMHGEVDEGEGVYYNNQTSK